MSKIILDNVDYRIIDCLYHDSRMSIKEIAKKCLITRQQAEYRIKKFEDKGFVKKHLTLFNYKALGFNETVGIKLKVVENSKKNIIEKLLKIKNYFSLFSCVGNWNISGTFIFRDKKQFEKVFYDFLDENQDEIINYEIIFTSFLEFYPMKFLNNFNIKESYEWSEYSKGDFILSKKDIMLLRKLAENGRAKLIDISKKIGMGSDLILYKMRKFQKEGLILGVRTMFDFQSLGFEYGIYYVKLKNNTSDVRSGIRKFAEKHLNINVCGFIFLEYDLVLQYLFRDVYEMKKVICDINEFLGDNVIKSEILIIDYEFIPNTLPF